MGAGKSTLGKKLAAKLNFRFVDLDKFIEEETGKTIDKWFEKKGEEKFREIEKKCLHKTKSFINTVVATGGGTPCFSDNMQWINSNGTSVYLQLSAGSIFHRIASSKEKRPLIKDLRDVDLIDFISRQLAVRETYYRQCHFTVKGEDLKIEALVKLVYC